jgi:hypothetical protein
MMKTAISTIIGARDFFSIDIHPSAKQLMVVKHAPLKEGRTRGMSHEQKEKIIPARTFLSTAASTDRSSAAPARELARNFLKQNRVKIIEPFSAWARCFAAGRYTGTVPFRISRLVKACVIPGPGPAGVLASPIP